MPPPIVKTAEQERLWKKAKQVAKDKGALPDGTKISDDQNKWTGRIWSYVVGIFKRMAGLSESYDKQLRVFFDDHNPSFATIDDVMLFEDKHVHIATLAEVLRGVLFSLENSGKHGHADLLLTLMDGYVGTGRNLLELIVEIADTRHSGPSPASDKMIEMITAGEEITSIIDGLLAESIGDELSLHLKSFEQSVDDLAAVLKDNLSESIHDIDKLSATKLASIISDIVSHARVCTIDLCDAPTDKTMLRFDDALDRFDEIEKHVKPESPVWSKISAVLDTGGNILNAIASRSLSEEPVNVRD